MVVDIVTTVRNDNSNRHVVYTTDEELKKKKSSAAPKTVRREGESPAGFKPRGKKSDTAKKTEQNKVADSNSTTAFNEDQWIGMTCPVCKQGTIIKGKSAYGCSRWREGCSYRMPFEDVKKKGD
jgi:DNA topoisomerase-3